MILSLLGSLFSSVFAGGATGLFGVGIQRWADYKTKQLELSNEVELKKADAAIMAQEWASRTQIAATESGDATFKATYAEGRAYSGGVTPTHLEGWLLVLLDFVRGLIRPLLTVYLCVLTTLIYCQVQSMLLDGNLTQEQILGMTNKVVDTILYMATTATIWWFGSRNPNRK